MSDAALPFVASSNAVRVPPRARRAMFKTQRFLVSQEHQRKIIRCAVKVLDLPVWLTSEALLSTSNDVVPH